MRPGTHLLGKCDFSLPFVEIPRHPVDNVVRHLASANHWKHWRLVAFGEAQPTEAEWQAFAASMPLAPKRAVRRS